MLRLSVTNMTTRKKPTKDLAAKRKAAKIVITEADLKAARDVGFAAGIEKRDEAFRDGEAAGITKGIQLCRNLVERRKNDHGDRAAKAWFPGGHNIRQDECMAIELGLIDL